MRTKFDINLLNKFSNENDIEIIGHYEKLNRQSIINGKCKTENCDGKFCKNFRMLIQNKCFYCKSCQNKNTQQKLKATNLIKYGCEYNLDNPNVKQKRDNSFIEKYGGHPSQNYDIKEKKKQTFLKNYGVEHNMKSDEFKKTMKQAFINKYGVEHQMQISEVKQKIKETTLIKYGVEHNSQNEIIKIKKKLTTLQNFGVEYSMQSEIVKNRSRDTCVKKYGVEYPIQNSEIAEKQVKSCYKIKNYTFPSGNKILCQGYEPFALDNLIKDNNINENDIITTRKLVPEIWYNDENNKKHRHYVDIFIPSQNKCIEVKSTWTAGKKKDCVFLKQNAAKELGYNYEIWVYDGKGNIVNKYL
jgi:hypothetical protein